MVVTALLPWFPILLGVGVGGRLLGRTRGLALGALCALFWVVLVQTSAGAAIWGDPWSVATIVSGAVAIAAMGRWSGEMPDALGGGDPRGSKRAVCHVDSPGVCDSALNTGGAETAALQQLSAAIDQFDDWLDTHRNESDPWPKFDEFIRSVMYQCCKATHVKTYRLLSEGEELAPLREPDPLVEVERLSARRGIVGHVVTTGRSYLAGDRTQGEFVEKLAEGSSDRGARRDSRTSMCTSTCTSTYSAIAWCFAIRQGTRRLGAVIVGQLDIPPEHGKPLLRAVEQLINQFWSTLVEVIRSRSAIEDDPVSGLCGRAAFFPAAEWSLHESYAHGEPVAVAVIALEGLRELNDTGRWEVADELVREVAGLLRRKVRMDDCLGRFDGSRFILLLRRVDSELASLIVTQIMSRAAAVCGDEARWRTTLAVRCGVVGSGTEQPDLRTLLSRALVQVRRARLEDTAIASDLGSVSTACGTDRPCGTEVCGTDRPCGTEVCGTDRPCGTEVCETEVCGNEVCGTEVCGTDFPVGQCSDPPRISAGSSSGTLTRAEPRP
ncbi:MAG: GGDEF domain-containing protein [Phycisphaerae bacterium]